METDQIQRQSRDAGTAQRVIEAPDGQGAARPAHDGGPGTGRTIAFGLNGISAVALRALADLGIGDAVVVRDPVLDADEDTALADLPGVRVAAEEPPVLSGSDVVLATCPYGRADRLHDLGRAAAAAGAAMVPAWLDGLVGMVGPLPGDGGASCLRCYALRRAANDPRTEVSEALRRHATGEPAGRGAVGSLEPFLGVLGEICALEIHRVRSGRPSAGAHRVIEVDLLSHRISTRPVLPVPGCPDCGAGWSGVPQPRRAAERPGLLLSRWDSLVDEKLGVVQSVTPLPVDEDEPDFVHYLSTACNTEALTRLKNFGNNGGVATDHAGAMAKALGEAVERYCSAFFSYSDLLVSSYRDLPGPGTPPGDFALYSPEQHAAGDLPWRPFTEQAPVAWTVGTSLHTGEARYVPAAMVYVPYHYSREARDTPITQPISTGLAAGESYAAAALSGVCEAVERDAFTITWQARLSRPRIPVASLPPACRDRVQRFTDAGLRVELMDITTDLGVPTVLTVVLGNRPTSPALAIAAATHPDPAVAAIKSLEELAHTRKFSRQVMDYVPPLPVDVAGGHPEVQEQQHHLRFYCPQPATSFAAFAWAAEEERPFAELARLPGESAEEQLEVVTQRLGAADLDVLACDLTTPDVAGLGLSVVRVVVPGLHPLFMGHRNRALGGHRLYTVPQLLGAPGLAPGDPDNPYPHPFP